jgi:hypothetical protein
MIIPPTWNLPEAIRIRLGPTTYGRQRALVEDGHILLVLHKPPGPDDAKRESVLFWRNPAGEWQTSRGGPGPGGLKRHVQSYVDLENQHTRDYDAAEDSSLLFNLLEALTPLCRAARNMRAALQAAREAVKTDAFLIEVRDLAEEVERNFELLLEDVRNALYYRTAREAEEQARVSREALQASHRLNSIAALFLPLTAITSLFSMNFAHGLNEKSTFTFWFIFALGLGVGFAMKGWVLARTPELSARRATDTPPEKT